MRTKKLIVLFLCIVSEAPNEDGSKSGPDKVVMANSSVKSEPTTLELTRTVQQHQVQTTHSFQHATGQQPGNIILVRGSRAENGQIILQNTHELLSLLSEDDKPVLLQHPRMKAKNAAENGQTILFQPANMKNNTMQILQSTSLGVKKNTLSSLNSDGSITLQQRVNKNGQTDGTFLLQTLKRLDKSQSILVIRNTNNAASVATTSITATQTKHKAEEKARVEVKKPEIQKQINIPLGCGESIYLISFSINGPVLI